MKNVIRDDLELKEEEKVVSKKKSKFSILRASVMAFIFFTLVCGLFYTVTVTISAQALFPYEANGSVITVRLNDGTSRVYGSELIGQSYIKMDANGQPVLVDKNNNQYVSLADTYYLDLNKNFIIDEDETVALTEDLETYVMYQGIYLIGRNNSGAPSNASVNSEAYREDLIKRKQALELIGYDNEYNASVGVEGIPAEMITESGSGCDPEISYDTALYQAKMIAENRDMDLDKVVEIIDKYTKKRFLGVFGSKRVNVLMVNLALDGLL